MCLFGWYQLFSLFSQQIDNIQRVNNAGDVNVTFFVTQDGRQVPATEAAQNYQKLSKAELGSLIKLDVSKKLSLYRTL